MGNILGNQQVFLSGRTDWRKKEYLGIIRVASISKQWLFYMIYREHSKVAGLG